MEIVVDHKQVSNLEKAQISQQVKAELVEHLYRGCLPGTVTGVFVGIAIFIDFFGYTPLYPLIAWFVYYLLALTGLTTLYFVYTRHKNKLDVSTWLLAYSISMSFCAVAWGIAVFLIPTDNMTRQYIAFVALLMFATGYTTGSIGVFELCVVTLCIILIPLIVWCLLKGSFLYNIIAGFSLLYLVFLLGINRRSTQWFKDSLKLKLENNLVSYQANHDVLTNLPNQRMLPQYIAAAMQSAKAVGKTFAFVCFSLNRMEKITDSLGHNASNSIIQSVAERLNTLAESAKKSPNDAHYIVTISRKDEFNVIISPVTLEEVDEKVKKLFTILTEAFFIEENEIKLTASIGVSIYQKDGEDAKSLIANADAAMLQAKQFGGNRVEFYRAEINSQTPQQLALETDLHDALKNKQLQLYYQPLIDLKTNRICGMEALLRWIHPKHGFISPVNFIPLAEETGLILPIGEWILEEACRQTKKWHEMGYDLRVAVNISAKQLRQENLLAVIEYILKSTQFNTKYLELELTETSMLDETVIHVIKEFKKMGLSLAVDDFGTGYSGLSYLKRFSIDKLKIDQSFIRDIPNNNDSITIVSAIIAMGRELKIKTLAEGVETEEQLEFLKQKNCDYIQGYYYSKPLDVTRFTQLLEVNQGLAVRAATT